jgi:hypothetical protein
MSKIGKNADIFWMITSRFVLKNVGGFHQTDLMKYGQIMNVNHMKRKKGKIMDKSTLVALKQSIKHWEENLVICQESKSISDILKSISLGSMACALCNKFTCGKCGGCPISDRTGCACCHESPYMNISKVYDKSARCYKPTMIKYVKAEIDFLKSLLPKI